MPIPAQAVVAAPAYVPLFTKVKKRIARLFRPRAAMPAPSSTAVPPVTFSSPNPEIYTASSNRDIATTSYAPDLITETLDRDLEA